jgi:hypothetical protein
VWAWEMNFSPLIPTTTHPTVRPSLWDSPAGVTLVTTEREEVPVGFSSILAPSSAYGKGQEQGQGNGQG